MASPESTFVCRYRQASKGDVPDMARIRTYDGGSEDYWNERIGGYLDRTYHPDQALGPRVAYLATAEGMSVGFVAGHLSRHFDCQAELEWINVLPEYRQHGIGLALLRMLATWLVAQSALRVCVDVSPANADARRFYARHGAIPLKRHFLVWENIGSLLPPKRPGGAGR
ncbi:MAG TPA: GNAT family N-acetyltransferase [Terriglobales bacterium]|nr:GNAT family N-acetyltransferase [Terriglobales bacterium]